MEKMKIRKAVLYNEIDGVHIGTFCENDNVKVYGKTIEELETNLKEKFKSIIFQNLQERNFEILDSDKYDLGINYIFCKDLFCFEIEIDKPLFLDDEDFNQWIKIQSILIAIQRQQQDLLMHRAKWEEIYHRKWNEIRNKYGLSLYKEYCTSRVNGEITEIKEKPKKEYIKENLNIHDGTVVNAPEEKNKKVFHEMAKDLTDDCTKDKFNPECKENKD
jgi:predicted RNase H-like HicB family nuclease